MGDVGTPPAGATATTFGEKPPTRMFGIMAGKRLVSRIDAALRGTTRHFRVWTNTPLRDALIDFRTLVKVLETQPTRCSKLVVHDPDTSDTVMHPGSEQVECG
jgi:hypothetical protein